MINHSVYLNDNVDKWVTFVHGAGGSSSIWFRQIRAFKESFNILLIDLRGHGDSNVKDAFNSKYTFDSITADIEEVLEHNNIVKSHFIGVSLGTILIRSLAEKKPELIDCMVMGGAVLKLNFRSKLLIGLGDMFKSIVPYMYLYQLFAFVIMPKKNHKESRSLFVREAKKLYQKEFIRWFSLTAEVNPLLRLFRNKEIRIPTFYVMGEQDHLFLPSIKNIVNDHEMAELCVIKNCGHVVNVEQPEQFNNNVLNFLEINS